MNPGGVNPEGIRATPSIVSPVIAYCQRVVLDGGRPFARSAGSLGGTAAEK
jgi:hypothetical protein